MELPQEFVSVWVTANGFKDYKMGLPVEAASCQDEAENRTIQLLVPLDQIKEVYTHIDFHEFDIKR